MKNEKVNIIAPKATQAKMENAPKLEKLGRTVSKPVGVKKPK